MSEKRLCPQCGSGIPADAPDGELCPKCLMRQGLGSERPTRTGAPGRGADPPDAATIAPLFPDLEVVELIGHGGMGAVYKARQKKLDRFVALKVLSADAARGPAFAERFTREARALARVDHPNIVGVHDFGEAGGSYYLIMEYVDGANLRDVLAAGTLSPKEALAVVPQVCDALQFAHEEGIVHRDIKPENILLDRKGRVKIADFGLAKMVERDPGGYSLTATGQVMGTPAYMAPEQIERPAEVDHRADIYSLGVVFYEMLTGELPLGRFQPPSRKVQVDVRLDEVVLRALEKERDLRYQQASEVKVDVESIGDASPRPATAPSGTRVIEIRRPLGVVLVAVWIGILMPLILPVLLRVGFLSFNSPLLMSPRMAWQNWVVPGMPQSMEYIHARPLLAWSLAVGCILVAIGLLRLKRWSRSWAIGICLVGMFLFFPLGVVPAVPALVYLFRADVRRIFELGEGPAEVSAEEAARLEPLVR